MILADTRHKLTRNDAQLALRLIGRGSDAELARAEAALREQGIDALLDDPRLLASLLEHPQAAQVSLPLFFYVLVRHALRDVGETDRGIADYVSAILIHFGARQRARQVADHDDQLYDTLADLLADADEADGNRSFLVRAHLGNYALWMSGVFPDYIEQRRWRRGGPDLEYFEEMGRRGFELAAQHRLAVRYGMQEMFGTAAERFRHLRLALNRVSDGVFFPCHYSAERLMRQVRSEARLS
jgi:hypothetical protein